MTLLDRQLEFTGYLVAGFPELGLRGWDRVGACAVTGNATEENLCKPVTLGAKDHGSDGSLQWRLGRLSDMQSWCVKHFGDWKTLKAQAAFTLYETARDYPALDAELRLGMEGVKPADVRRVLDYNAKRFQDEFERPNPALSGLVIRQRHAASVYMVMSGAKAPVVPPKPKIPPIVTGGGAVVVAGGTAAGGAVVVGAHPIIVACFGLVAVIIAIAAIFLARLKKLEPRPSEIAKQSSFEKLTALLEQRVILNAEIAETADEIRDGVQTANDLLAAAGEPTLTIEHQPAATIAAVIGEPTLKA